MQDKKIILDIRAMEEGDCHHLMNIDLKSSEFQYDYDDWHTIAKYFHDWRIVIGAINKVPVSFATVDIDLENRVSRIHKFSTLEDAKKMGVHAAILQKIEYDAFAAGLVAVEVLICETECKGTNDPYDISNWLLKAGYRCEKIEHDMYIRYGENQDMFIFEKKCFNVMESYNG